MKLSLNEARRMLLLNKNALDEACMTQADIFYQVGSRHSEEVSLRDELKEAVAAISADIAKSYRDDAAKRGEKITESKLQQLVIAHDDYQRTNKAWLDAKHTADIWSVTKESFLQRASMIKELCGLYVSGYFSDIAVKGDTNTEAVSHVQNRSKGKVIRRERARS